MLISELNSLHFVVDLLEKNKALLPVLCSEGVLDASYEKKSK